jgi:hypothetical protein
MAQRSKTLRKEISKDDFLRAVQEKAFKYLQEFRN